MFRVLTKLLPSLSRLNVNFTKMLSFWLTFGVAALDIGTRQGLDDVIANGTPQKGYDGSRIVDSRELFTRFYAEGVLVVNVNTDESIVAVDA